MGTAGCGQDGLREGPVFGLVLWPLCNYRTHPCAQKAAHSGALIQLGRFSGPSATHSELIVDNARLTGLQ